MPLLAEPVLFPADLQLVLALVLAPVANLDDLIAFDHLQPGKQFQTLLDFIQEVRFDRLGAFMYSPEEDTAAYRMPDDVSASEKEERLHRLMRVQELISSEKMQSHIGKVLDVMVEKRDRKQLTYHGRSVHSAPDDIDGEVLFSSEVLHKPGTLVKVRIDSVNAFDMHGTVV